MDWRCGEGAQSDGAVVEMCSTNRRVYCSPVLFVWESMGRESSQQGSGRGKEREIFVGRSCFQSPLSTTNVRHWEANGGEAEEAR